MAAIGGITLTTRVVATPDVRLAVTAFKEPSAAGGIRAHVITKSDDSRGREVWLDAPELRQLRDKLTEILGDEH